MLETEIMAHKPKPRRRLEQDGMYLSRKEHWELIEKKPVYITSKKRKRKCILKDGTVKTYVLNQTQAVFLIPLDVVRHLKLKHKDKISVAIRHK